MASRYARASLYKLSDLAAMLNGSGKKRVPRERRSVSARPRPAHLIARRDAHPL